MDDEKSTTTEIEQQRLKAGIVLKQAAAICDSNRDALVAICKQKAPAFAGADEGAKAFVEVVVHALKKTGFQLNPGGSSKVLTSDGKPASEEIQAMMQRSGRAVKNATSIRKANRDMLLPFFKKEGDQAEDSVALAVDALNTYAQHLTIGRTKSMSA
jgi:hypothetical protein